MFVKLRIIAISLPLQMILVTQVDSTITPLSNGHSWCLCGSYSDLDEDDVFQDALR